VAVTAIGEAAEVAFRENRIEIVGLAGVLEWGLDLEIGG
jgi:hypothetical protein